MAGWYWSHGEGIFLQSQERSAMGMNLDLKSSKGEKLGYFCLLPHAF
jgi:hypothetical protein